MQGGRGKGPGTQTCLHFTSCCCHCSLVSLSKLCSVMGTDYSHGVLEGMQLCSHSASWPCLQDYECLDVALSRNWMAVVDLLDGYPAYGLNFPGQWVSVSSLKTACRNSLHQKASSNLLSSNMHVLSHTCPTGEQGWHQGTASA